MANPLGNFAPNFSYGQGFLSKGRTGDWRTYKIAWGKWKWQDALFTLGEIIFLIGLLPSVFGDHKPDPLTSFPTAVMLYLFCIVHVSFRLWVTLSLTWITATLWIILGVQAI